MARKKKSKKVFIDQLQLASERFLAAYQSLEVLREDDPRLMEMQKRALNVASELEAWAEVEREKLDKEKSK